MNNISQRAGKTPSSPLRKFQPLAQQAIDRGRTIHYLNIGQPDLAAPASFFSRLQELHNPIVSYTPSEGCPGTLSAWQQYYASAGVAIEARDVIVTAGASEALLFAFLAVCDPGDEIIVFEPTYPSYISLAAMLGIRLVSVALDAERGFHLPPMEQIAAAITDRTRAVIVCNPANPTGTLYRRNEIQGLMQFAAEYELYVIADEVYREFNYTKQPHYSVLEESEFQDHGIVVDSVSKRFNLCGARVGALITTNSEIRKAVIKFAQSRLSVSTIEQYAVIPILENSTSYLDTVRATYNERRLAIHDVLSQQSLITWYQPEGAFYLMVTLPVPDVNVFIEWLLTTYHEHNETVLISPGTGFYTDPRWGAQQARIAFVLEPEKLKRAITILISALKKYPDTQL